MSGYIDTSELDSLEYQDSFDYPTPSASSDAETSTKDDAPKKKRKAWGQPVPDIVPILPPRKRAKTAEEKEQRKNERILRNRRAADKSRQRQKAAQAELEQQNKDLLVENAQLKALLQQHGLFSSTSVFTPPASVSAQSDPTETPISRPTPEPLTPEISQSEPSSVAPELDLDQIADAPAPEHMADALASNSYTDLMQYPAVVLSDLQCQSVLDKKLRMLQPNMLVNTVLTLIQYLMTWSTSSHSMPSPMSRLFQILEQTLATTSNQLESIVQNNFPLIHILISMPSTSTQPAVLRLKLLSRLLACNPNLAPLLKTAADRALQQTLTEENWTANPDHRWTASSLMTIKWSIMWLNNEHLNMRMQIRNGMIDRDSLYDKEKQGVDCGAVEQHYRLFDEIDPKPCTQVTFPSVPSSLTSIEVK